MYVDVLSPGRSVGLPGPLGHRVPWKQLAGRLSDTCPAQVLGRGRAALPGVTLPVTSSPDLGYVLSRSLTLLATRRVPSGLGRFLRLTRLPEGTAAGPWVPGALGPS